MAGVYTFSLLQQDTPRLRYKYKSPRLRLLHTVISSMPQLATRLTHPDIMSGHHSNYQLAPLHYAWHIGGILGVLYWRPPRLAPKLLHPGSTTKGYDHGIPTFADRRQYPSRSADNTLCSRTRCTSRNVELLLSRNVKSLPVFLFHHLLPPKP
jgi:hypothetical protein